MFKKFLSVFFLLSIVALTSAAGVPRIVSYQGKITDGSGAGFNGTVTMEFAIYDTVEGGTPLWSEVHTGVTVDHGLFAVMLGTIDMLNLPFDKPYYLQITVDGTVLVPRMLLTASPYAVRAAIADSVPNDHDQDPENEIIDSVFWEPVDTGVVNYSTLRIVEHSVQWDIVIPVAKDSLGDNSIGDLADADTTGKFAGAILKYDGTQWVPAPDENTNWDTLGAYVDTSSSVNRFHDVNTIGATDGQVLTWIEAAGQWRPMTLPSGADNWGTQTVVSDNSLIGDGTTADTLRVNWDTLGGYYDTLALQTPGAAKVEWQNIVDVPDSVLTDGSATNELIDTMVWNPGGLGTNVLMVVEGGDTHFVYIPVNADSLGDNNLGDIGNVNTAGASDGQVLTWVESAGEWRPTTVSGGGGGDNWGTQVVQSDISLNGDGTAADPLRVNWDTLGSYYDTLSLQTPGAAQVEWQNIVNVPESVLTDGDTLNEKISAFEWEPALAENELLIVEGGDSFNVAIPVDEDNLTDNSIGDLADVNTAGASDGQVLTWVESAGEWRPTTVGGTGGGDNWGTQVVQSDISLNGDGTGASPLSVNWDTLGAYYDTLGLQTPGGAKIEWQNIVNVPDSVLTDGDTLNEKIRGLEWETLGDSVLLVIEGGDSFTVHIPVARDKLDDNSITDLGDVNTGGVGDGQVLKWFASSGEWRPADDLVAYGDNWGTQVVITDNSLIGDGTIGDTLKVNWDTLGAYYDTLVLQTPGFAR
ncbi:hypothetical protein J7K99_01040, partial [bacterium]|nr:hypothetical protein [bacterium]